MLPFDYASLKIETNKGYLDGKFWIKVNWTDTNENIVRSKKKEFDYFFDFVHFVNNDLSDADFSDCDGIANLLDISDYNIQNAVFTSNFYDKFRIDYERNITEVSAISKDALDNEETTYIARENKFVEQYINNIDYYNRVYYISDIHLDCKIKIAIVNVMEMS